MKETSDVVVVGSGLAGFTAAIHAAKLNARVTLLEKTQGPGGGNSFVSNGFLVGAGTSLQKEAGIEDTPERFYEELLKMLPEADTKQLRAFAFNTTKGIEWLRSLGIEFHPVVTDPEIERSSFGRINRRVHIVKPGTYTGLRTGNLEGLAFVLSRLEETFHKAGGTIMVHTRATKIRTDAAGKIIGIEATKGDEQIVIGATAVVLTCGGFQGNKPMLLKYVSKNADKAICRSGRDMDNGITPNTGEGHAMAQELGAKLINMNYVYAHTLTPPVLPYPIHEYCQFAVLVNKEGKRFVDESIGDVMVSNALLQQPDARGFIILDSKLYRELAALTVDQAIGYGAPKPLSASSFEELSSLMHVNSANFIRTMKDFNDAVAQGTTDRLQPPKSGRERPSWPRNDDFIRKIDSPPYYAVLIAPGITFTSGGVLVDDQARIVDQTLKPIPGLYAAGEITGGLFTDYYISGGSLARAVSQGLVAGRNAAEYAKNER